MTIGSLFSGIGGFELGLEWAGMGPVLWQVEKDEYCQAVLAKHWPEAKRYGDIRDVGKHNLEPVDLICGGPPCQPVSCAGKRKGKNDDRWLWDEALRVISELAPRWVILENPPGILGMAEFDDEPPVDGEGNPTGNIGDVYTRVGRGYTDEKLETLKAMGYKVTPYNIPACAVGALHERKRVWIVAHSGHGSGRTIEAFAGRENSQGERSADNSTAGRSGIESYDVAHSTSGGIRCGGASGETGQPAFSGEDVPDNFSIGIQGHGADGEQEPKSYVTEKASQRHGSGGGTGYRFPESRLGGTPDGVSDRLDLLDAAPIGMPQYPGEPPRLSAAKIKDHANRLKALGNAVVPQIPMIIGFMIREYEDEP